MARKRSIDRNGPDPDCTTCRGKGIYSEFMQLTPPLVVHVGLGKSDKPLPCAKCWANNNNR